MEVETLFWKAIHSVIQVFTAAYCIKDPVHSLPQYRNLLVGSFSAHLLTFHQPRQILKSTLSGVKAALPSTLFVEKDLFLSIRGMWCFFLDPSLQPWVSLQSIFCKSVVASKHWRKNKLVKERWRIQGRELGYINKNNNNEFFSTCKWVFLEV